MRRRFTEQALDGSRRAIGPLRAHGTLEASDTPSLSDRVPAHAALCKRQRPHHALAWLTVRQAPRHGKQHHACAGGEGDTGVEVGVHRPEAKRGASRQRQPAAIYPRKPVALASSRSLRSGVVRCRHAGVRAQQRDSPAGLSHTTMAPRRPAPETMPLQPPTFLFFLKTKATCGMRHAVIA